MHRTKFKHQSFTAFSMMLLSTLQVLVCAILPHLHYPSPSGLWSAPSSSSFKSPAQGLRTVIPCAFSENISKAVPSSYLLLTLSVSAISRTVLLGTGWDHLKLKIHLIHFVWNQSFSFPLPSCDQFFFFLLQ